MGSSISAIYDDYEDYTYLCEKVGEIPVNIRADRSFYDHEDEILKKHGFKSKYELYEILNKQNGNKS